MKKNRLIVLVFIAVTLLCFRLVFSGRIPIPADTIVGLYHPFRDLYAKEYPRGIPFKNPLITDSVSQQIPWRTLAIEQMQKLELPLWNPYSMAGYPLLGNIQSAPFYPLNIVFFILPFLPAWTFLIIIQTFLGSLFMYFFLRNQKLSQYSCIFGAVAFGFSGFFLSWLEWGTISQTALWIPLVLLSIDKIITKQNTKQFGIVLFLALCSAFLAGHLQTFIYGMGMSLAYFIFKIWPIKDKKKPVIITALLVLACIALLTPVWMSQLQLILLSARNVDLSWTQIGWFIPREHIIQFIAPDFFGNPATGNYFGVWNYGEFLGYVGIAPLFFAVIGIGRKNKTSIFFAALIAISLLLAIKSPLAKLPFMLNLPLFSSTQPTRLLFIVDFSLSVLAAFGLERLLKEKKLSFFYPGILVTSLGLVGLFGFLAATQLHLITAENWSISLRNLILPTLLVFFTAGSFICWRVFSNPFIRKVIIIALLVATSFDLLLVSNKYNSFSKSEYFFPQTKALLFLENQPGQFRIMTTDRILLHPNFQVMYKLQSLNGYDPLYLERYGELMAAMGRRQPDISRPFGFFRIVTPDAFDSKLVDLMGVKYVLSNRDLTEKKLVKVYQEGLTQIYQNKSAFPRAFFIRNTVVGKDKQDVLNKLFDEKIDLRMTAIIENESGKNTNTNKTFSYLATASITQYTPNHISVTTDNPGEGFLVFTDTYYPTWHALVDGREVGIVRTDYNFRGITVPKGRHTVQFINKLF